MTNTFQETSSQFNEPLFNLTNQMDAMKLAQLCAFAFMIPQLYFCREYLNLDEDIAIKKCLIRLDKGLAEKTFTMEKLSNLLNECEFFDSDEARLRLQATPE